ncbi:MAG: EscU/YscU/HrcU family type III secretion system export apparatus switch protein [Acidobacteriota bacterium]
MPAHDNNSRQHRPGAVALRYQSHADQAPRVTAKGRGAVAEKIIALAKEHHVPIVENADLLMMLSKVELMDEIPEALYGIVAQILAYVYSINEQLKKEQGTPV